MTFTSNLKFILAASLFFAFSVNLSPAQTSPARSQPIMLFEGNSMAGWTSRDGTENDGWIIQDGTLHRSKRGGDLYFNMWFKDFELTFEWKLEKGGNSGVKYRVKDYGKQSLGCEFQCQDDTTFDKHSAGGLYALFAPDQEKRKLKPAGEWNHGKIVVCGNRIEHWLNGEQVVKAVVGNQDWLDRVKNSKFSDKPGFGQNPWGRIFLQDHGNPVWFRDITLTPLVCNDQCASVMTMPIECTEFPSAGSALPFNAAIQNATIDR